MGVERVETDSGVIQRETDGSETGVESSDGGELTPSGVQFAVGDRALVGEEAKRMLARDPENVVTGIKRQMGSEFQLEFHGRRYTPEGISGPTSLRSVIQGYPARWVAATKVSVVPVMWCVRRTRMGPLSP